MKTFAWPIALATLTVAGLTVALVGGAAWSPVSWLALGAPLATIAVLCRRLLTRR